MKGEPDAGLDPNVVNKKQIKASITNAIAKLVTGSNRDEIALRVEETYERLLVGATVFTHSSIKIRFT
jgi:hypothetical protein